MAVIIQRIFFFIVFSFKKNIVTIFSFCSFSDANLTKLPETDKHFHYFFQKNYNSYSSMVKE